MIRFVLTSFFGLVAFSTFGQKDIDTTYYNAKIGEAEELWTSNPNEAHSIYQSILQKAKLDNYLEGSLKGSWGIGKSLFLKKDYDKSLLIMDSIAKIAQKNGFKKIHADALLGKTRSLLEKEEYYKASTEALKALEISETINSTERMALSCRLLGNINITLENFAEAKKYYTRAKALTEHSGNTRLYFINSYNYCNCLMEEGNKVAALECLNKVASELSQQKDDRSLFLLLSYVESARLECKPEDARVLNEVYGNLVFLEGQAEFQENGVNKQELYLAFAKYYVLKKKSAKAQVYLDKCKNEVAHFGNTHPVQRQILLIESDLHNLKGDYKKAMELYTLAMKKRLEALKNNEANRIEELNRFYATEKKDGEIAAKDLEMKLMTESSSKRQWFLIFLFCSVFVLALVIFVAYLKYRNGLLNKAREVALEAAKAKSVFLDVMTHELRTPLSTISGSIYLLENEKDPATRKGFIKAIKFSSEYLNKLIENTILLKTLGKSKPEKQETNEPKQRFNCQELVEGVRETLAHSQNNNQVEVSVDHRIPEYIIGPELDLSRILVNLVSNSDKFTHNGLIKISVQQSMATKGNGLGLTFTVSDNGDGIRDDEKERIFDAFYSGKAYKDEQYPGMGLGLNLVKGLLEKHNAAPKLESVFGLGTSISFTMEFDVPAELQKVSTTVVQKEKPKGSILLVEDNKANQNITKQIIEKLGYHCDVADNGQMAIEKYRSVPYSLVLMDMMMPVMNGFEASASINEMDPQANIVALTAVSREKYNNAFKELNINTVISKPVNVKVIKETIESHLNMDPKAA